jgi:hypothetical protein
MLIGDDSMTEDHDIHEMPDEGPRKPIEYDHPYVKKSRHPRRGTREDPGT